LNFFAAGDRLHHLFVVRSENDERLDEEVLQVRRVFAQDDAEDSRYRARPRTFYSRRNTSFPAGFCDGIARGVTDMVRISDARMSGTAFGTVVLHVAPEAAAGGPLRAVRDGDPIVLDVDAQRLDRDVPAAEIERRLAELGPVVPRYWRGYSAPYLERVLQADEGCDFDFLRAVSGEEAVSEPCGLLSGWVGGW